MQFVWINEIQFSQLYNVIADNFLLLTAITAVLNTIAGNWISLLGINTQLLDNQQLIVEYTDEIRSYTGTIQQYEKDINKTIRETNEAVTVITQQLADIDNIVDKILENSGATWRNTVNLTEELQNVIKNQEKLESKQESILEESKSIKSKFGEFLGEESFLIVKQTEILEAIKAISVLEALNKHVQAIEFVSLDAADTLLDTCAYDPLGVGPIECVGTELAAGTLAEVKFT